MINACPCFHLHVQGQTGPTPTLRLWDVGPLRPRAGAGGSLRRARRLQLALRCPTVSEGRVGTGLGGLGRRQGGEAVRHGVVWGG